jgi:hypothetical protein
MKAFVSGFLLALTVIMPPPSDRIRGPAGANYGFIPISELGTQLYLGSFPGGLYGHGSNQVPPAHLKAGLSHAAAVRPLDAAGRPDPAGRYVLLSIGMSNTTQEFWGSNPRAAATSWSFAGQAAADGTVNHTALAIVDGAAGGQDAKTWISPSAPNYDRVRDEQLAPLGLGEAQVQAIWLKQADIQPTVALPKPNADAYNLEKALGNIVRACKVRYPNLQVAFLSSRIYAGYAATALNPEPYAYESGFSVQRLVDAQADQTAGGGVDPIAGDLDHDGGAAPWIGWGPYLWADGANARFDGLVWLPADLESDGTHPSRSGQQKVGRLLLTFFLQSPFSRTWFRRYLPGDIDGDGAVAVPDLKILLDSWQRSAGEPDYDLRADLNGDNRVDIFDLRILTSHWTKGRPGRP